MDYFWELPPLAVGFVVLLREERSSCGLWSLGLDEWVYPNKNGHVRSVEVRPGQSLHDKPQLWSKFLQQSEGPHFFTMLGLIFHGLKILQGALTSFFCGKHTMSLTSVTSMCEE